MAGPTTTTIRATAAWAYAPGVERLDQERAGFWRSILRRRYAGEVWHRVSALVRAGELGPAARLRPLAQEKAFELRVYVADIGDRAEVDRVRRGLWRMGFRHPIACYDWRGRRRWRDPGAERTTPKELWRPR
ncbi:DUF1917 domain-containing protein [Thermomicrobiaceae bacterium CFH 74404]|uniref:DUF1917 domain-containing protein n=1 Tax=Thermalbibacter longus TaxID=2951981 RepID=A0AA42BAZ7_9BACT|nr:putative phosphothreonine lyase domain-containg protein [Thermalbibacter longus]MCM8750406.1 DUF1917 domain-containing protein [Thermalbibacter longus]